MDVLRSAIADRGYKSKPALDLHGDGVAEPEEWARIRAMLCDPIERVRSRQRSRRVRWHWGGSGTSLAASRTGHLGGSRCRTTWSGIRPLASRRTPCSTSLAKRVKDHRGALAKARDMAMEKLEQIQFEDGEDIKALPEDMVDAS